MNGYICRTCRHKASLRSRSVNILDRGRHVSRTSYQGQGSLDANSQTASREGAFRGQTSRDDQHVQPSGRYSSRALRPQQVLDQLANPPPRSDRQSQERRDGSRVSHYMSHTEESNPSIRHERPLAIRELRSKVVMAFKAKRGGPHDLEVWPLLLELSLIHI